MLSKIKSGKGGRVSRRAIYAIVLLPIAAVACYSYFRIERLLNEAALARRHEISMLAATVLTEKFDRLSDIGVSLATRVRFAECVELGRWREAITIMESVPKTLPFIDRIFLTDAVGTMKADAPALPGVIGKNFAFRDWYIGVRAAGTPYISEVYRRTEAPQFEMIALAVPVRGKSGTVLGILVLQIRTSTLLDWVNELPAEFGGDVEVMDQKGHPASRAARGGKEVAAVVPLPKYGWTVVARQTGARSAKSRTLRILLAVYGFLFVLAFLLARLLAQALEALEANEAALTRARDEALETTRTKSEFVASISHEIRTPMNTIIGITELLQFSELSAGQREDLKSMSAAGGVLMSLINDILDFSKLEARKMIVETMDFDLRRTLEASAALLEVAARNKGLRIVCSVSDDTPLALNGDPRRLNQILTNLLSNAVKFTEHGEIRLQARKERESETGVWIRFEVRDTGIGIAPAQRARLFQPFVQADSSTTREYGGTGLGLAISKMLADLMGGEIGFDSEPGQGSTFWLRLKFGTRPKGL